MCSGYANASHNVKTSGYRVSDASSPIAWSRLTSGLRYSESIILKEGGTQVTDLLEFHGLNNSSQEYYLSTYSFSRNVGMKFQWRPYLFDLKYYSKTSWPLLVNSLPTTLLYEAVLQRKSIHSRDPDSSTVCPSCAVIVTCKG